MLLTLHCEESARLQSDAFERDLTRVERWAVRLHFLSCRACANFRKQLRFLHEAAERRAEMTKDAELTPEQKAKIAARLRDG